MTHGPALVFPGGASGKEHACQGRRHETWVQSLSRDDPLEESVATHSSILAWRIPWTEEPVGLQSMGSQRLSDLAHTHTWPYLVLSGKGKEGSAPLIFDSSPVSQISQFST